MGNIQIYSIVYVMTQIWHYDPLLNIKNMLPEKTTEYKGRRTDDHELNRNIRKD